MGWSSLHAVWLARVWIAGTAIRSARAEEVVLKVGESATPDQGWTLGQQIPVTCLNRTIATGEHVMNDKGELQYIPFPVCNETGRPLELVFGSEADINCTLVDISDSLFHLFEYYIHNDAPLSCRLPANPPSPYSSLKDPAYINLQIALSGTLQLSHLHINPQLNVIVHTTSIKPSEKSSKFKTKSRKAQPPNLPDALNLDEGHLLAASAYSLPYMPVNAMDRKATAPQIIIGDTLPLVFSVRWFSERTLPPSTARLEGRIHHSTGLGGHVHLSTVVYCLLSFGGGVAVSLAYWRGVELPRRLRRYGIEKLGMGFEGGRGGYAFPGIGKRD